MNHDPLCPMTEGKSNPLWKAVAPVYDLICECDLIAQVREDELAKCIAAVDDRIRPTLHPLENAGIGEALAALRDLQEKP